VARFGALVVTLVEDAADDEHWPDEHAARREFADRVASLTLRAGRLSGPLDPPPQVPGPASRGPNATTPGPG
jgi:hypothetical protein